MELNWITFRPWPVFLNLCRRTLLNPSTFPTFSVLALLMVASGILKSWLAIFSIAFWLNKEASLDISLSAMRAGNCETENINKSKFHQNSRKKTPMLKAKYYIKLPSKIILICFSRFKIIFKFFCQRRSGAPSIFSSKLIFHWRYCSVLAH